MRYSRQQGERLHKALAKAHQTRENIPLSQQWQDSVMRSVRALDPTGARAKQDKSCRRVAWRLAPAAGILLIVLAVLLHSFVLGPEKSSSHAISLDDPAEVVVAELFWIK